MIFMHRQIIARIGGCPLSFAIVINDQVARKAHQPVRKVAERRIVLVERTINPNEDLLRQVFRATVARSEPIRQIVDPARVLTHDLRPGLLVAFHTTLNQFSIGRCQRELCSHLSPSRQLIYWLPDVLVKSSNLAKRDGAKKCFNLRCSHSASDFCDSQIESSAWGLIPIRKLKA